MARALLGLGRAVRVEVAVAGAGAVSAEAEGVAVTVVGGGVLAVVAGTDVGDAAVVVRGGGDVAAALHEVCAGGHGWLLGAGLPGCPVRLVLLWSSSIGLVGVLRKGFREDSLVFLVYAGNWARMEDSLPPPMR